MPRESVRRLGTDHPLVKEKSPNVGHCRRAAEYRSFGPSAALFRNATRPEKKRSPPARRAVGSVQQATWDEGYFLPFLLNWSLSALAGVILMAVRAGILICSPVAGLRPMRALRSTSFTLPRPPS